MSQQNNQNQNRTHQARPQAQQGGQARPQESRKEFAPLKLTDTLVEIDPVGAVYTVDSETISQFVVEYLASKDITDAGPVIVDVADAPNGVRSASLVLFFRQGSRSIETQRNQLPRHMRHRAGHTGYRASSELTRALQPMLSSNDRHPKVAFAKGFYAVELDIFHVLAMMLAADPNVHTLQITEIGQFKRQTVLTVFKMKKFVNRVNNNDLDQYQSALNAMRRK